MHRACLLDADERAPIGALVTARNVTQRDTEPDTERHELTRLSTSVSEHYRAWLVLCTVDKLAQSVQAPGRTGNPTEPEAES